MDKEGHPVEFSSEKISEKKQPDFFVASNEKTARRARFSIGAIFGKIGKSFKFVGTKISNYIKHPIRGKHKIVTIVLAVAVVVATVLIVLNVTIWQKTSKDTSSLSEEEHLQWGIDLASIISESVKLSDDDLKTYYANLIKTEKREYKSIDLTIEYTKELARRGFISSALDLLKTLDKENMECGQIIRYYEAYASAYYFMSNGEATSDSNYYNDLALDQEEFCLTGEYPSAEGLEEVDPENIVMPDGETENKNEE